MDKGDGAREDALSRSQGYRGHLPHGVQDVLQEQALRRRRAEAALRDTFSRWAYQEVITPTFEYDDSLTVGAGPDVRQAMYRFFDREGQTLALRADFTTQVARVAATKLLDQPLPMRCFYIGSVFRCDEPQVGRQREFTQAGVELIGANTAFADAEVVSLAVAAIEALGIADYQLNLGQMALFRALTAGLPADALNHIREATDSRNSARLLSALDAAGVQGPRRRLLTDLPDLMGGLEILEEARGLGGAVAQAAESWPRCIACWNAVESPTESSWTWVKFGAWSTTLESPSGAWPVDWGGRS